MSGFSRREAQEFKARKQEELAEARQTAAFFLATGIDLSAALAATPERRKEILRKVERLLERERLKGLKRHWSYDLNRHIALSQAWRQLTRHQAAATRFAAAETKAAPGGAAS